MRRIDIRALPACGIRTVIRRLHAAYLAPRIAMLYAFGGDGNVWLALKG